MTTASGCATPGGEFGDGHRPAAPLRLVRRASPARYAARINGLDRLVVTKLDVLSGFERIGIVKGYRSAGQTVGFSGAGKPGLDTVVEWFEGWNDDLSEIRRIADLPAAARRYVAALEANLGVPIDAVSLGPERASLALA